MVVFLWLHFFPKALGLKQYKIIVSQKVLESRSPRSRCRLSWFGAPAEGKIYSMPLF